MCNEERKVLMKRILIINWRDIRNPEAGGAEIYFHEIYRRLAGRGYECTVLAHGFKGGEKETVIDGLRIIRIGGKFLFNYSVVFFLLKHGNEFDIIVEDLNKLPFFTPLYIRKPRFHMVMHFFGTSIFREAAFPFAAYIFLMEKLIPLIYKKERFVAISQSTMDEIRRIGISPDKITIIEPGVDTSFYHATAAKEEPPVIAHVGRLMKYKNVQFIIRALPQLRKKVPGVKLVIGGGGDHRDELEKLARKEGVEDVVVFLGRISEETKRELLSKATLFANPSTKEGWGINNIEANLCGTVSLSSNVPGLKDSVQENITGLLYDPDNVEDFTGKAAKLLTDNALRTEMENNALSRAKTFDWDNIADRMESFIRKYYVDAK